MAFDGSAIKTLLDGAVARSAVHGIAALVVDRNGPLFHHAAGEATEGTLFRNASMTKAATTTGALQLVEQGRLSLDATVESILPDFGQLQCWKASTPTTNLTCARRPARRRSAS